MKKLVSAVLALTLVLAMGMTALAEPGSTDLGTGSQNIDVAAKYEGGTSTPTVYQVDVAWGAMEFTYAVGGTNVWDPETHTYTDNSTAQWTASGNTVTVTNHSNAEVAASFAFAPEAAYGTVQGSFDQAEVSLPSAEGKAVDAAELTGTAALTLGGTLDSSMMEFTKVGTITVTIQ